MHRNYLKPKEEGIGIKLGNIEFIILPDSSSEIEVNVSALLSKYWRKITGKTLGIQLESSVVNDPAIYLGNTRKSESLTTPGNDGIAIYCDGKNIILKGGERRGLVNAVFTLLNEDFGCRFYGQGAEYLPKLDNATIVNRAYTPVLELRDPFYFPSFNADWSLKNRTNAFNAGVDKKYGGHISYPGEKGHIWFNESFFCHTYHSLVPPEKYFACHPEYYELDSTGNRIPRQLCETNLEVQKICAQKALQILRASPYCQMIDISKIDGGNTCCCHQCSTLNKREGADSASMLTLVNYVADAIKDEFPHVFVSTAAYLETIYPPRNLKPRPNVSIRFCNDIGAWRRPFTPVRENKKIIKILELWRKSGIQIFVWDYNVNFSHYAAPMPNMDIIADNIRFWVENGVTGLLTQGAYQSHGAERDILRSWCIAQLMWNPQLDEEELQRDFIEHYFGKAANLMLEYHKLLRENGKMYRHKIDQGIGIRYPMDCELLEKVFIEKAEKIYRKALKLTQGSKRLTKKIERDFLPVLYVKICQNASKRNRNQTNLINEFERIAREVKFFFPGETPYPSLDWQLKSWREGHETSQVKVTPNGGKFTEEVVVNIEAASSTIWLTATTDGSTPTYSSPRLENISTLTIKQNTVLKIGAFMLGSCVGGQVFECNFEISCPGTGIGISGFCTPCERSAIHDTTPPEIMLSGVSANREITINQN